MGMFDWVKATATCPKCQKVVNSFQSKDKDCNLDVLEFSQTDNFYMDCSCKTWIEFQIKRDKRDVPASDRTIYDYDMFVDHKPYLDFVRWFEKNNRELGLHNKEGD